MVQDGGVGNSLIWVPTDEPPHMGGSIRAFSRQLEACRGAGFVKVQRSEKAIPSGTPDV